jgi:chemotaxis protein MotB
MDQSWRLSFARVMTVYQFLGPRGAWTRSFCARGFGSSTRHTELTAEGRRKNRRVDIILDKRNAKWQEHMGLLSQPVPRSSSSTRISSSLREPGGAGAPRSPWPWPARRRNPQAWQRRLLVTFGDL